MVKVSFPHGNGADQYPPAYAQPVDTPHVVLYTYAAGPDL